MYHILIVDDDPAIGDLFERMLVRLPMPTVVAAVRDGVQALQALGCMRTDLLITDYDMPNMDGVRLVQELRGAGNRVPILFLAGAPDHRASALQAGATKVAYKPLTLQELLDHATRLLSDPTPDSAR